MLIYVGWVIVVLGQFLFPPFLMIFVSVAYYRASPHVQHLGERLLVSAPGALIAALWFAAFFVSLAGDARPSYGKPFAYALLVPLLLMVLALLRFKGRASVHYLQLLNLAGLALTFYVGSMAITGRWL
jgi:hypothetical protein